MRRWHHTDDHQIQAATGWLELGDCVSALQELENLRVENVIQPDVLKLRWRIYSRAKKWNFAFTIAHGLTRLLPDDPEMFIWRSQSARQMNGGSLLYAFELLLDAASSFPHEPVIPFYLACYSCALQRIADAKHWVRIMFEIAERNGTSNHWSLQAFQAIDLEPLWKESAAQ